MRLFLFAALISLSLPVSLYAHNGHSPPPWQAATDWPDRIITTFADDPATTLSITWRTDATVGRTIAQIAPATPDTRFDLQKSTLRAKTERTDLNHLETEMGVRDTLENHGLGPVHYHSVTFTKLKPDTLYAWRVQGARGHWSEWFQTRTAPKSGPVSFVYFGDAQNGVRSHWSRVIRAANQTAPQANFFLHAGDLVDKGDSDSDWAEWFTAGGFIHARTPSIPVRGNHENITVRPAGPDGPRHRMRTPLWRPQFTLPVEKDLPQILHESVYDVRYSEDLHVFVLDSARRVFKGQAFRDQARWLEKELRESDARWKVVTMHHPYFVTEEFDRRESDKARREAFSRVIKDGAADLVLTGHIHTYGRMSEGGALNENAVRRTAGSPQDVETVYVISASGAKNSDIFNESFVAENVGDAAPEFGDITIDRVAGNTPMFQVIRIDEGRLSYTAYTATGEAYDAFLLEKTADGRKQLTNGAAAFGDVRLFSNTGAYVEWWDLQ